MKKIKNIFLFGIILMFLGILMVEPVRAQDLNMPGSEKGWGVVEGLIKDPWAIFEPIRGFKPAGVDFYSWTENARNFIGEFQNALSLSPAEAVNLVLGKTSGIIWLDTLINFIKSIL